MFKLTADYQPTGDQPQAIKKLTAGLQKNFDWQVLLGVTGSGKTFTVANVIANYGRPTLVIAHNKTLAAQLWVELKEFFPENAVHYFVSYYDYYQPEAYLAATNTYIEKDLQINEEIDRLRHAATHALLTRQDVIIVATVSCIYGLGSPDLYSQTALSLQVGQMITRTTLIKKLIAELHFERNDLEFTRGRIRVAGDTIDIYPAYGDSIVRVDLNFNSIDRLRILHPITYQVLQEQDELKIFPAKHYFILEQDRAKILKRIRQDLQQEVGQLKKAEKIVEAQRLQQRTKFDLEMIEETGYVKGIENYSLYFDQRAPGSPPSVLLDYFPPDYLLIIDESHMTIPQIAGMSNGDLARKNSLIEYGFRLKAARDNRPLNFDEFRSKVRQVIATSATPADWELQRSKNTVEQLIRPTGLLDPKIEVRPQTNQINDLIKEVKQRVKRQQRVLIITLTKRMSEDLTEYLLDRGIKVNYLHSDIGTIERTEILQALRKGGYDVVVGINLLREGLDLPEVSLVAILDADKEGFLRSETALIQTAGRAARHQDGLVIMYADHQTGSMGRAITETTRRRRIQEQYNLKHKLKPQSIQKAITASGFSQYLNQKTAATTDKTGLPNISRLSRVQREFLLADLKDQMRLMAENLDFEQAALIRDQIKQIQRSQGRGSKIVDKFGS